MDICPHHRIRMLHDYRHGVLDCWMCREARDGEELNASDAQTQLFPRVEPPQKKKGWRRK